MPPEDLAKLAHESAKYDSISTNLGLLNIGLVLLTAVVTIFTFYYGNKLSNVKEKIANQKIAEANEKAAVANEQAATANLKAQAAIATAELAKAESASATVEVTEAKNKQTKLAIDLTEAKTNQEIAQKENAKAQLALNLKIEEDRKKAKPRKFSVEQRKKFLSILNKTSVSSTIIDITVISGDGEAKSYALELDEILKSANWLTAGVSEGFYSENPTGIFVKVKNGQMAPQQAILLLEAFKEMGIFATGIMDPQMLNPVDIGILIGHKP